MSYTAYEFGFCEENGYCWLACLPALADKRVDTRRLLTLFVGLWGRCNSKLWDLALKFSYKLLSGEDRRDFLHGTMLE
jgi:hypothetical protein